MSVIYHRVFVLVTVVCMSTMGRERRFCSIQSFRDRSYKNVKMYLFYDRHKTLKTMHLMTWARKFFVIFTALVIITSWQSLSVNCSSMPYKNLEFRNHSHWLFLLLIIMIPFMPFGYFLHSCLGKNNGYQFLGHQHTMF